ncbi:maleylpyruvate isomerase N-terminal domain-containing protein [Ruania zhangjianzhongii]|uniref:maleylpyruvate isomerase N-terminal domain-containing protein n=1 Tax=Ruania zhangjianzhongii TaxID=2603206 RepID=UPI0011CA4D83|nr:maleylpyruvate isomerase N-terminal domain-containing protein [Ruania zhangjianzhongii]
MTSPAQIADELRDQWDLLRTRLEDTADTVLDEPSSLPGWSVRDLVAHLGLSLDLISRCELVAQDPEPLTFAGYLAACAEDAERISDRVLDYSAGLGRDVFDAVDEVADRALERLDELVAAGPKAMVRTSRGVISTADFLLTRLLELVVHTYDLAPVLVDPVPVDTGARHLVAEALVQIVADRAGYRLIVDDEEAWILAASGRIGWDEAVARGAVRPEYLSDGVPDLGANLPLL